jgi:zinc transporter ZupT
MKTLRRWLALIVLLFAAQILIGNIFHESIHHAASLAGSDDDCPVCQISLLPNRQPDLPDITPYLVPVLIFVTLPRLTERPMIVQDRPHTAHIPRGPPSSLPLPISL